MQKRDKALDEVLKCIHMYVYVGHNGIGDVTLVYIVLFISYCFSYYLHLLSSDYLTV